MNDSELIDWEQLSMIFGDSEEDFDEDMAELFQDFVEDGNQSFEALRDASFSDQKEYIAKESHKLKGSASNFGFARVADLLGRIEDDISALNQDEFEYSLKVAIEGFSEGIEVILSKYPALNN